ncbi:YhcN/YlaJ family sporulation lipoprotein [Cohnella cellulosilytica]|uniref:YhcN/YlaJ family sporulation lipoprotein n=1 Tax=Cohnella cellulosilytica TaxID=986710 RepID=A0ABW2F7M7_9BACL
MKTDKTIAWAAAALLAFLLVLGSAGCGSKQANPESAEYNPRAQGLNETADGAPRGAQEKAAHLEALARGVEGVQNANCVVFGKYAIVGIDVDEKMERSQVGTIKYAVAEAFRKDPYGIDALVTADIDMGQRIREIRADIRSGRPISGFTDELADIVGRLIPQIPRNIMPPREPENFGTTPAEQPRK